MRSQLSLVFSFSLFFTAALSWGGIGHRTIGYLSEKYMTPQGAQLFNGIINPSDDFDISDAAVWADNHRTGAWAYTYNWHFIDARDSPPSQCDVEFKRDCDARDDCSSNKNPGCVVGAIANMTSRIASNLDTEQIQDAMKFLLHFVGDSHQPLHVENLDVGGNNICIMWHGKRHDDPGVSSHSHGSDDHSDRMLSQSGGECPPREKCKNLHAAWDTLMIEKLLDYRPPGHGGNVQAEKSAAQQWATDLFGDAEGNPELDPDDCVPTAGDPDDSISCALKWASESNDLVCSYVLKDGVVYVENKELSGKYYNGAVPIIKSQISRSARRFAAIMNTAASGSSAQKHRDDGQKIMEEL